jgi:dTDP-4-amino-4,6-dideoxygalactose transaminase
MRASASLPGPCATISPERLAEQPPPAGRGAKTMTLIDWKVPLGDARVLPEDLESVIDVYLSGWLSMGPRTQELEAAFADYTGAAHCVAVSSGSAALHLACLGADLGPGDRVILPSITFVATANAIAYCGAEPVFADIVSESEPWLSPQAAEAAVDDRTRAIMAVCYGGHPGEIVRLRELADARGLTLLEDAAHGAGCWAGERHAGTIGRAGAFSFSAAKSVGVGEGGMLATDDAELAERVGTLRWHGVSRSSWSRHNDPVGDYDVAELGFNYRLDDPRAALALARLRRLEAEVERRTEIDAAYRRDLGELDGLEVTAPAPSGSRSGQMMFTVVLGEEIDRDGFRRALAARGVQTSVHFPPLHRLSLYSSSGAELPRSEAFGRRTVSLPMFAQMEEWQRQLVIDSVAEALLAAPASARSA